MNVRRTTACRNDRSHRRGSASCDGCHRPISGNSLNTETTRCRALQPAAAHRGRRRRLTRAPTAADAKRQAWSSRCRRPSAPLDTSRSTGPWAGSHPAEVDTAGPASSAAPVGASSSAQLGRHSRRGPAASASSATRSSESETASTGSGRESSSSEWRSERPGSHTAAPSLTLAAQISARESACTAAFFFFFDFFFFFLCVASSSCPGARLSRSHARSNTEASISFRARSLASCAMRSSIYQCSIPWTSTLALAASNAFTTSRCCWIARVSRLNLSVSCALVGRPPSDIAFLCSI
mmetsp:Transcript_1252/g.2798  ORF Transcript_1252/g.2798 Transcript_1252/m.2798 type:complete len:295 (+) Transcript_1252:1367-2251(+)